MQPNLAGLNHERMRVYEVEHIYVTFLSLHILEKIFFDGKSNQSKSSTIVYMQCDLVFKCVDNANGF